MDVIDILSVILRGDPGCVEHLTPPEWEALRRVARQQGVLPLVVDRLSEWSGAPAAIAARARADASGFAAAELLREVELRRVLQGLAAAGVDVLLLKGAALAYTHYERPDLRPRDDADLLVAPAARAAAHDALVGLGYRRHEHVAGTLVSYQAIYDLERAGVTHTVDLHWRIANPQIFAGVLEFDEARATAVPIPALGPGARGLSPAHALLLACVHRVAHHRGDELLIWLYDIHLIAPTLAPADWMAVADLARRRGVLAICQHGLERARHHFHTPMPETWLETGTTPVDAPRERTAEFLRRDRAQFATFLSDLRTLSSWRDRRRLVREHLFPSASYMRESYAPSSRAPLPVLYAWRALRGAWRWLARG